MNTIKKSHPQKFWKTLRRVEKTNTERLFTINNKQTKHDITNEFAEHFSTLLNFPRIQPTKNARQVPEDDTNSFLLISSEDIRNALLQLKSNKSADPFGLVAEHLIAANNDKLSNWLATLFNNMFEKGVTEEYLSKSTIIPLVNSLKKSLKNFDNYTGISIIPIITKLLECVILLKYPAISESHPSQFGFKLGSSTLHAEYFINETLIFYNSKNSPIYMCSLDAEKAFDSVNWDNSLRQIVLRKKYSKPSC